MSATVELAVVDFCKKKVSQNCVMLNEVKHLG